MNNPTAVSSGTNKEAFIGFLRNIGEGEQAINGNLGDYAPIAEMAAKAATGAATGGASKAVCTLLEGLSETSQCKGFELLSCIEDSGIGDEPTPPLFEFIRGKDYKNRPHAPFLVDNLFRRGEVGVFFGKSGSGKTFAILDMAYSMCEANHVFRELEVSTPLNVCYTTSEGTGGLSQRVQAANYSHNPIGDIYIVETVPQLFNKTLARYYEEFIKAWESRGESLDVLIIDTLQTATLGAEIDNNNAQIGDIWQGLKDMAKRLGVAIVLIHHTQKSDKAQFRGGQGLEDNSDFMFHSEKDGEMDGATYTIAMDKLKDGRMFTPLSYELKPHFESQSAYVNWCEPPPPLRTVTDKVLEVLGDGVRFTSQEIALKVGSTDKNIKKVMDRLVSSEKVSKTPRLGGKTGPKNPYTFSINIEVPNLIPFV